jgi:hypothetical protein
MHVNEILIREALVFCGAVVGAVWGYYLGKTVERRRFASEVSATLETFERWAIDVCRGLEDLERSFVRMSHFTITDLPADRLVDARVAVDAIMRSPSLEAGDQLALRRFLVRVTTAPEPSAGTVSPAGSRTP